MTTLNPIADAVIKRDRNVVIVGLTAVITLAAIYTVNMARGYDKALEVILSVCITGDSSSFLSTITNNSEILKHTMHGGQGYFMLFGMWTVMQIAMMSPTAIPMVLMHTKVQRSRYTKTSPLLHTFIFFMGYIIVWTAFSAVFAGIQVWMQDRSLLTPAMASASPWLAGGILIAAGAFQFSKLKEVCLNGCRSPVSYFMTEWREGFGGTLWMGIKHGVHCVGCCWVLMALLFVAGVMNLLWMGLITAFVLTEKVMPKGDIFGRVGGVGMLIWGIFLILLA